MTFAARCTGSVQIMVLLFESVSRHQRLGCSLQQCSAVCFQLQQQVFCFFSLSPPIWLGPQVAPRDPTFCGGEWGELHTSHVNLDSVHSKVMCSSFKHIRVCVYYMKGFSLICLYPLLLLRHSYLHRLLNQQNSCNAILGISCRYQSVSISASDEHCYPSAMGKHSLHVPSAFSAAAASVCWSSQHPSSRLYSLTPGKMPLLAYLSHTPRHFQ